MSVGAGKGMRRPTTGRGGTGGDAHGTNPGRQFDPLILEQHPDETIGRTLHCGGRIGGRNTPPASGCPGGPERSRDIDKNPSGRKAIGGGVDLERLPRATGGRGPLCPAAARFPVAASERSPGAVAAVRIRRPTSTSVIAAP